MPDAPKQARPHLCVPAHIASALAWAVMEARNAPRTGIKRIDADSAVGDVLLALNGAPLAFRGPLNPDAPEYPSALPDPVVVEARAKLPPPFPIPGKDWFSVGPTHWIERNGEPIFWVEPPTRYGESHTEFEAMHRAKAQEIADRLNARVI